jgi:hypothetical protein
MAKQSPKKTAKAARKTNTVADFEPNKVALAVATTAVVSLVLIVLIMVY